MKMLDANPPLSSRLPSIKVQHSLSLPGWWKRTEWVQTSFSGLLRQTTTTLMAQNNVDLFFQGPRGQKLEIWLSHNPPVGCTGERLASHSAWCLQMSLGSWEHPSPLYPSSHGSLLSLFSVCLEAPAFIRTVVSGCRHYHRSQMDSPKVFNYYIEAPFLSKSSMPTGTSSLETE